MKQEINIIIKTIKKIGEYPKPKLNSDAHLMLECGLVEPLIKLNIK